MTNTLENVCVWLDSLEVDVKLVSKGVLIYDNKIVLTYLIVSKFLSKSLIDTFVTSEPPKHQIYF